MIVTNSNLLNVKPQNLNVLSEKRSYIAPKHTLAQPSFGTNLLAQYLDNIAKQNSVTINKSAEVSKVSEASEVAKPYKNDLKTLLLTNSATIMAIIPRIFNSKDVNGNEYIDGNEVNGTFLKSSLSDKFLQKND